MDSAPASRTAKACLAHPASLFAVGILLVNDHLLKALWPGWFTGKLSDFVGLFFFPYLVALALSVLLAAWDARRIRRWAFSITAAWFVAAKATSFGHVLTLAVVRLFVDGVVIVRDPSDTVALLALAPAWSLWSRCARQRSTGNRWELLAAMLAGVACLATSPSGPRLESWNIPAVLRVSADEGAVTAIVGRAIDPGTDGCARYRRRGAGHWERTGPSPCPDESARGGRHEAAGPGGLRFRLVPGESFRAPSRGPWDQDFGTGEVALRVVESHDGGATWSPAWEVPRTSRAAAYLAGDYDPQPDLRLDDLAISDDGGRLVVGFRTEGVVIRESDGTWVHEAVGPVSPTVRSSTVAVMIAALDHYKWGGVAVFLLAFGSLLPAAWLGGRRRDPRRRLRVAYAVTYLAAAAILAERVLHPNRDPSSTPHLVRGMHAAMTLIAGVIVAASPIVTALWLRRQTAAPRVHPRLRPALALAAGVATPVTQTAWLFLLPSSRSMGLVAWCFVGAPFFVQVLLAWHETSAANVSRTEASGH